MESWITDYQQSINESIDNFFAEHYAKSSVQNEITLREAVIYAVSFGKSSRIHPLLAMVSYEEFLGITAESIVNILIGLEFIHTSLMLHEDVAGVRNTYKREGIPMIQKYGSPLSIIVGDILYELGIERLSQTGNMQIIRELLISTGESGFYRGVARDILTDHATISEREYLTMYDEKIARNIISSFIIGSMIAGDSSQLLRDQYRQFGTFLARIYQVGHDIDIHEKSQESRGENEFNRERGVIDFLGYEKAKSLYDELYIELMKMTGGFQNTKFGDLINLFRDRTVGDI